MIAAIASNIKTLPAPAPFSTGQYVKFSDLTDEQLQQALARFQIGTLENHLYLVMDGKVIARKHASHFGFDELLRIGAI